MCMHGAESNQTQMLPEAAIPTTAGCGVLPGGDPFAARQVPLAEPISGKLLERRLLKML